MQANQKLLPYGQFSALAVVSKVGEGKVTIKSEKSQRVFVRKNQRK